MHNRNFSSNCVDCKNINGILLDKYLSKCIKNQQLETRELKLVTKFNTLALIDSFMLLKVLKELSFFAPGLFYAIYLSWGSDTIKTNSINSCSDSLPTSLKQL